MMHRVRYEQRNIASRTDMEAFLSEMRTGVVSFSDSGQPYAVPVNYVWLGGNVYFHGLGSGRKFALLSAGPQVCFLVYQEYGTVKDPVPCHADTSYKSVMLFGRAEKVGDSGEAAEALQKLLEKFMPGFYPARIGRNLVEKYRSSLDGNTVAVYRIVPQEMTGKENIADANGLFQAGEHA